MSTLLERVRRALAPDYEVLEELARGGMGVVFLARDVALNKRVAVKIVRPEVATATAMQRFIREARLLASLHHPNAIPVHRAGDADGIAYFVMEYVEGETLAKRLERGPLTFAEALRLGRDMLHALEAVHRLGVVHRDVKPSNIFLVGDRAVLGDFGIARPEASEPQTGTGTIVGTPGYLSPEQVTGEAVSPRADLYAVAVVLYEALTGRRVEAPRPPGELDWHGVPGHLAAVLRRGLAWSPEARWPDAAAFRRALWTLRTRPYVQLTIGLTALGILAGASAAWFATRPRAGEVPRLRIEPFRSSDSARPWLADSVARLLASNLSGFPDFAVSGPRPRGRASAVLGGSVRTSGDTAWADVHSAGLFGSGPIVASARGDARRLDALAEDLARNVVIQAWTGETTLLPDLPRDHLPRNPRAVWAFLQGEHAFARSLWGEALKWYGRAEAIDSTCQLCSWRLYDAERWNGLGTDPRRIARFVKAADSFPPLYRSLMHAPGAPLAARLDTLLQAEQRHPRSPLLLWSLGEELFHRGPLVGHARREAIERFARAAEIRADFAPAWEHLTWAYTAEGDSAAADAALRSWLDALGGPPTDSFTIVLGALLETGFAWRFLDTAVAAQRLRAALRKPEIAVSPYLMLAPRLLPTFDALGGAVWLGRVFATDRRPHFQRFGILALVLAHTALGRPDSAATWLRELLRRFPEEEAQVFAAQYRAALAITDPSAFRDDRAVIQRELERRARTEVPEFRQRVAWSLAMLSATDPVGAGAGGPAGRIELTVEQQELVDAVRRARGGEWLQALDRTLALELDSALQVGDPTLRGVLRLLRAEWFDSSGNVEAARRDLRWAEHYALINALGGLPQTAEVDWALRTVARWRRARVLDRAGVTDWELCASYAAVARDWANGTPVYAARADSARARVAALGCQSER